MACHVIKAKVWEVVNHPTFGRCREGDHLKRFITKRNGGRHLAEAV